MTRIYTKKGDDGTTSLWYGGRVAKSDARTEAYGALDEAASALGVARSLCGTDVGEIAADILRLQDDLFIAGAELATAPDAAERLVDGVSRVTPEMTVELETLIDRYMERVELPPKFVIPGGTQLSAQLDLARAILRRAERRAVALDGGDGVLSADLLTFLNRASDAAYALARAATPSSPSCSPAASASSRRPDVRVVARRRDGYTHEVETDSGPHARDRRAGRARAATTRAPARPAPAAAGARRLHRDHLRDVRGAQGLGARRGRVRGRDRAGPWLGVRGDHRLAASP